jgi:hypothetical protein
VELVEELGRQVVVEAKLSHLILFNCMAMNTQPVCFAAKTLTEKVFIA